MQTIQLPAVDVTILNTNIVTKNTPQKILFVGQKTSGLPGQGGTNGTAVSGVLTESIQNGGAEDDLFGSNSMIAALIRANKVRNQQVQVDAIALDDDAGANQAVGNISITGLAVEAATLTVITGSERNHKVTVSVPENGTASDFANEMVSAINLASIKTRPVIASTVLDSGIVDLTAIHGGEYGNSIPLEVRGTVTGTTAITVNAMTGGTGDPVLTSVLDPVKERRYQAIVWGYPTDIGITTITGFLDPRFNATGEILNGVAFTARTGTTGELATLGATVNSQSLLIIGDQKIGNSRYQGGAIVEIPLVIAAQTAGFRGLRLDTSGFNISDIVTATSGALDAFGGSALASKPYFNTPYPDLAPIQTGRGFTRLQIETLTKVDGISVIGNNPANTGVVSGQLVTTYKTDAQGNPDVTFTFLNFVDTATEVREFFQQNLVKRFAQSRLTLGDVVAGHDQANEKIIRSFFKRLYQTLSGPGFVLLQSGVVAAKFFKDNLTVTLDLVTGKATITMIVPIVTQLRIINVTMQVAFSTSS